jgi:hypothetical protein
MAKSDLQNSLSSEAFGFKSFPIGSKSCSTGVMMRFFRVDRSRRNQCEGFVKGPVDETLDIELRRRI